MRAQEFLVERIPAHGVGVEHVMVGEYPGRDVPGLTCLRTAIVSPPVPSVSLGGLIKARRLDRGYAGRYVQGQDEGAEAADCLGELFQCLRPASRIQGRRIN